ncbi:MAG: deoxyribonuclease IV [Candidatus Bathyarchaeota archaeon]|nr:deoxyribonuclease IV [Candidatus Bathyarchaeota archaeon]
MKLGFHVSITESIDLSFDRATKLGCTTFQIFTRNPRAWRAKPLQIREIKSFRRKHRESKINPVFSHMPYIPNLASPRDDIYEKSLDALIEEIDRCNELGIRYIVTHIGSHTGSGVVKGKTRLIQALGRASDEKGPMILLENSSGSGDQLGSKLNELAEISKVIGGSRVGICFDTCHAFAAGYNIASKEGLNATLREISRTVGFSRLKLVHLNDSLGELGSRIDHHEHIGLGKIGQDGFRHILASQLIKKPLIMETPIDDKRSDIDNMKKVYEFAGVNRQ